MRLKESKFPGGSFSAITPTFRMLYIQDGSDCH
jgi:hypothetical protein